MKVSWLRLLLKGNTNKIRDVMPEEVPPLRRSLFWGLQIFLDAAPATVVGVIVINQLLTQRGVPEIYRLDPLVALVAAGIGTLIWMLVTRWKMPNFMGTSFTYIAAIAAITASMVGKIPEGENPISYATGAVVLSSLVTLIIAGFVYLASRSGQTEKGVTLLSRLVPKVVAVNIVVIIGLSLASVGTGMVQKDIPLGLATLFLAIVFRYLPGYWGTIPLILSIAVMYGVSILQGHVDLSVVTMAPIIRIPEFILPRFNLLGLVQMTPVSIATSFETLGHILVLEKLLARPLMNRLWLALVGDALSDPAGGTIGAPGNTTYAEVLGLFALTRVFSNVTVVFAAIWAILFGFSGHLNAILNTIPEPVVGGVAILTFGMIAVQGYRLAVDEGINFGNIKVAVITAAMLIIGVGNLKLVIAGTEWLSGISFAIVVGILGWPLASLVEGIAKRGWRFEVEPETTVSSASITDPK